MSDLASFSPEDAQRIIRAVKMMEKQTGGVISKPGNVSRDAIYAKVLVPIEIAVNPGDPDDPANKKQATAIEVYFDFNTYTWIEVVTDPIRYDKDNLDSAGATLFDTTNISSKSALSAGKIVELQHYPNLSEDSDWLVVEGGGGAERPYVIITSVIGPSEYIGDVLTSPDDPTVKESTVDIRVPGALANPFEVGYTAFSDKVEDVYYLEGDLLG